MWATILGKLVGTLPSEIVDYYKQKRKLKNDLKIAKLKGKIDLEKAKAERKAAEQAHVHNWEAMYVQLQASSWKDELVLLVLIWPLVGVFIPGVQGYVITGFEHLEQIPEWWVAVTVALMLAIYGIRHKRASKIQAPGLTNKED